MRRYENPNVDKAELEFRVNYYCPLGENYSVAKVKVEIELDKYVVELLDIQNYYSNVLNGIELTQEGLCAEIFNCLKKEYEPKHLLVEVFADGHIPMKVIKETK